MRHTLGVLYLTLLLAGAAPLLAAPGDIRFKLTGKANQLELRQTGAGEYEIRTTGSDPYVNAEPLKTPADPARQRVLAFDYMASDDPGALQVFYGPPIGAAAQAAAPLKRADRWTEFAMDLQQAGANYNRPFTHFRFDFGSLPGVTLRLRNLRLTAPAGPAADPVPAGAAERVETVVSDFVVLDFAAEFDDALATNSISIKRTAGPIIDGVEAPGIFEHSPKDKGSGNATITYPPVALPTLSGAERLVFAYHKKLNVDHREKGADGVAFVLSFDGREVHRSPMMTNQWEFVEADISAHAGKTVTPALEMDPVGASAYDQAVWGDPKIIVRGRRMEQKVIQKVFGIKLDNAAAEKPGMVTVSHDGDRTATLVSSLYKHLDLDAATKAAAADPTARPLVPRGPRLVAGEGPHPDNHTVVRVLSRHQLAEVQFLAFPPAVRGGVDVHAGDVFGDGETAIVANPFAAVGEIRIFDRFGGLLNSISPDKRVAPPYAVAVGDFLPARKGDEIAVAAREAQGASVVLLYAGDGALLTQVQLPRAGGGAMTHLVARRSATPALVAQDCRQGKAYGVDAAAGTVREIPLAPVPANTRLFASVYGDRAFSAGGAEETVSTVHAVSPDGARAIDAGREENMFWIGLQSRHGGDTAQWQAIPDGKYVRIGRYNFLGSPSSWTSAIARGNLDGIGYDGWNDAKFRAAMQARLAEYAQGTPKTWSPIFTHRWSIGAMANAAAVKDDYYGLPKYLVLDCDNETIRSGHFGQISFIYGSYNFESPGLNDLYVNNQREFLKQLAPLARRQPEFLLGVEPNHENEIVSGEGGKNSIGDYNVKNIEGFYRHLLFLYGSLANINRVFGASFSSEFFDAPRNKGRGPWDAYDDKNPFYVAWYEYNTLVVYRRVGRSFREALLAGFPPEMVKCHQIPDAYVFGFEIGFATSCKRITPIDWMLTAGTGYGLSQYGVWYNRERNSQQGANSSGFDSILRGEYASLTPDANKAYEQLAYIQEHGGYFLHVMWWPASHDKGFNKAQQAALERFAAENDKPRPGVAGGVGSLRPYKGEAGAFDIAALGTGERCAGLLKSIGPDGKWEGTVYAVPFHAHVDIATLLEDRTLRVTPAETGLVAVEHPYFGMQLELSFTAASSAPGNRIRIRVYHQGQRLEDQDMALTVGTAPKRCRVIHKLTLPVEQLKYTIVADAGEVAITGLNAYLHEEKALRLRRDVFAGVRHKGGVTFDILPEGE